METNYTKLKILLLHSNITIRKKINKNNINISPFKQKKVSSESFHCFSRFLKALKICICISDHDTERQKI